MDFLERLKDFTEGIDGVPHPVNIGVYNEDRDSVAIRPAPSAIDSRYVDKGKIYPFSFQVLVHTRNNMIAYGLMQRLVSEFESVVSTKNINHTTGMMKKAIESRDGSYFMITLQCTTTPNYVQETSHGVLWTAMFNAELYIKGGESIVKPNE